MKLTNYIKKQYCFLKKKKIIILAFTVRIISIVSCFLSQEGNVEDCARNPFRTNEIIFIDYDYYRVMFDEIVRRKIAMIASVSTSVHTRETRVWSSKGRLSS